MLSLPTTALARALPTAELEALQAGKVPAMHLDVFAPAVTPEQHELITALAMRATDLQALATSLQALAVAVATPPPAPVVHVHVPEQLAAAPVVHVAVPEQAAPVVHFAEQAAPTVTVKRAAGRDQCQRARACPPSHRIQRDDRGRIEAAEEVRMAPTATP